jgi:uncharacterized protein YdhG (YjbR/CyaY superfamily)
VTKYGTPAKLMKNAKPQNVDAYIAAAPKETQGKLKELRAVIKKTAPDAEERLSYGMPYYAWNGRLAYFSVWKEHIGLYVPTPVVEEHAAELAGYEINKATVRLPLKKRLPVALIKKLITARLQKNAAKGKSQAKKTVVIKKKPAARKKK